jgi:hypothetical protein
VCGDGEIALRPAPGEHRTLIIVWSIDDPSKKGDPRYWWEKDFLAGLRGGAPDAPDLGGKPKGQSLASLQQRAEESEFVWAFPSGGAHEESRVRLSLEPWRDADPKRTYLIVSHQHAPIREQQAAGKAEPSPWPAEVETVRQDWLAALAADEPEKATALRHELDAELKKHGFRKPGETSAWNPDRAIEIQPGVFLQDERTDPPG